MSFPFIDKTSAYLQAIGYYDSDATLMTGITAVNGMVSAVSGVSLAASTINKVIYGSASRQVQFTAISIWNGLVLTGTTALGLSAVNTVWARVANVSGVMTTDIWLNVWATQGTAITFKAVYSTGANVATADARGVNLFGMGSPA